jgi:hypothetical protein
MAQRAADRVELGGAIRDRGRCNTAVGSDWSWWSQEAHEKAEALHIAHGFLGLMGIEIDLRFQDAIGGTLRILFALILENLVGHAHLSVVGFAGEESEGFVLRFPAESGHRTVIAVGVDMPGDAQSCLSASVGAQIGPNRGVRDSLQQASAKCGRRYPEDYVVVRQLWTDLNRSHQQGTRGRRAAYDATTEVPADKTDASVEPLKARSASMVPGSRAHIIGDARRFVAARRRAIPFRRLPSLHDLGRHLGSNESRGSYHVQNKETEGPTSQSER